MRRTWTLFCLGITLPIVVFADHVLGGPPAPNQVARRVDAALQKSLFDEETKLANLSDDATFLRRIHLDLTGNIPTPEEVIAFSIDPNPNKRRRAIWDLLDSEEYGQNWARYWRDVVFFRALDSKSNAAIRPMETDLAERLNAEEGWDKIAADFVTAQGNIREQGTTAIIMAQDGRTEETTAEISRIFLGIQIQCAQCHDHPYDRWKREDFHELAAFFPRVGIRGIRNLTQRSFEIYGHDRYGKRPPKNEDNNRPQAEHVMPDLEEPSAPGTIMQPKFFLTSATLPKGTADLERRQQLASWITENEWFSIALVNRLWAELVGEGFYEPIDDIGPDRSATAPQAMKLLAKGFQNNEYNVKWLIETICLTDAYQRDSRPRRGVAETPFAANVPQPLRSDQLFSALITALELSEAKDFGRNPLRERERFAQVFGYDPSQSRESIAASIPQILAMMNSGQINRHLFSKGKGKMLKRLLKEVPDNEDLVVELYLRSLSREPSAMELSQLASYYDKVRHRPTAFEDILWALVNSAEFRHRR